LSSILPASEARKAFSIEFYQCIRNTHSPPAYRRQICVFLDFLLQSIMGATAHNLLFAAGGGAAVVMGGI
jgi:hypothetical protein